MNMTNNNLILLEKLLDEYAKYYKDNHRKPNALILSQGTYGILCNASRLYNSDNPIMQSFCGCEIIVIDEWDWKRGDGARFVYRHKQ